MRPVILAGLPRRTLLLILVEHLLVVASAAAAVMLVGGAISRSDPTRWIWRASLIAAVLQVCLHCCDLYDLRRLKDRRWAITGVIQAMGAASLVLAVLYYWLPSLIIERGVFVITSIAAMVLVSGWRVAFDWLSRQLKPGERLLIVGTNPAAVGLARELYDRRQELGIELVGFVDSDPARVGTSLINPGIVGTIDDIPAVVRDRGVDRVVVSLADARGRLSMEQLLHMKLSNGVRFEHLASMYEAYTGKIAVENLRPSWLVFSDGFRSTLLQAAAKRSMDVVLSAIGLLFALPLMGIVALVIRKTSPGPAVYKQQRTGKDGRVFTIYKFRSMRSDAEAHTGAIWSKAGDPRVTPVGRLLRRTRLDELPQLWNVLKGDMSFVGPRPERPEFVADLAAQIPFYGQRHVVRPGLTGWAQVRHSYGSTVDDALQKLQYELFYIKHQSLAFDMLIMLETVKTVLVREGS